MNKYLCAFLVTLCSYSNNSYANEKIYVDSKDVMVADNGIYVKYDDNVLQTRSIVFDDNGIYFIPTDLNNDFDFQLWICPDKWCLHHNPAWYTKCSKCGGPPPNYKNK